MKTLAALALGAGMSLVSSVAAADAITTTGEAGDPTAQPIVHERRGGLVIGAAGGIGFAGASGYPNNARFLNNPDYYSESPLLVGYHLSGFLMGALTDWLNIGPTLSVAEFSSDRWKSTGFGVGFRAEVFPLLRIVPSLADLSVYGQLGVGVTELRAKGPYPTADGSQSFFGAGLHYEKRFVDFLGAHASAGPFVEYDAISSQPAERHWLAMGLRVAFYSSGRRP
ncbi:MAG: hypothetical protein U0270_44440 [Labilithrix sp.]